MFCFDDNSPISHFLLFRSIRKRFMCCLSLSSNFFFGIVGNIENHTVGKCQNANTKFTLLMCKHSIYMSQICQRTGIFKISSYGHSVVTFASLLLAKSFLPIVIVPEPKTIKGKPLPVAAKTSIMW